MSKAQMAPKILIDYSRCDDQSRVTVEEPTVDQESDAWIAEKVDHAFGNMDVLRSGEYGEITVAVRSGVVFLDGHVLNTGNQQQAESAASMIPGVLGVRSNLIADNRLLSEVAGALGKIEHEYGVKFFTGVRNGVVALNGEVENAAVRSLAEKCAAEIPGVRGVINSVRVPGMAADAQDPRFLQPVIGGKIYFLDGLSGQVQSVIINPNNRLVIAMVLRGRYSNSQQDPRFLSYGEAQTPERLITIPVSAIRYLTKTSGFLNIDGMDATSYKYFDPSCFTAPSQDWTPPYPYCLDDIWFPVEALEGLN